jgi:transposase
MRGTDSKQEGMFSYVSPESRIPTNHPLRPIRAIVAEALAQMDRKLETLYAQNGRPSIAPERLIRALLLQVLYTIRSERLLVEQLEYNLLFRWFVGLSVDEPVWDHSTFSKNRDRLFGADIARDLFESIIGQARATDLLSDRSAAFARRTARTMSRAAADATRHATITGRAARMTRMPRARILRRGNLRRAAARVRSCAIWVMR